MSVGGQRCAANDSSRGGCLSYPFSSLPFWGRMKKRHVGGPSRGYAKIWRSRHGPLGRMVKPIDEGRDGSPARTIWQEPFIQAATGGFLRRRPLKTQLLHNFRQNVEQFGVYACASSAGLCRRQEGGVVRRARQLFCIWSQQRHAVVHVVTLAPTKRDQIARSRRGTLVKVSEEGARNLSMRRKWGTRGLSRRGLPCLQAPSSSAPLLFPHKFLKRKLTASTERQERSLQWGHSALMSAVSVWVLPKPETYSPCLSAGISAQHLKQWRENLLLEIRSNREIAGRRQVTQKTTAAADAEGGWGVA